MKNMYEGMFIFPKALGDEEVNVAITSVQNDIEKCGGQVKSVNRLGVRHFVRELAKQEAGYYAVIIFEMDSQSLVGLRARLKLNEKVFRNQIVSYSEETSTAAKQEARSPAVAGGNV